MDDRLRVILIGGTSNIGKSTLAAHLAARLGWRHLSTDQLGRYPGRPWATPPDSVKPHVVEHYRTHDAAALVAGQIEHYRNMWPIVETEIRKAAENSGQDRLVLEGSGIWPACVATLKLPTIAAIWLTGSADVIRARIERESRYAEATPLSRLLIDRFVARSHGYDREMMRDIRKLNLPAVEIAETIDLDLLADQCLSELYRLG